MTYIDQYMAKKYTDQQVIKARDWRSLTSKPFLEVPYVTSDDTDAIASTIAALGSEGGTILIPRMYVVTSPIIVDKNFVELRGIGRASGLQSASAIDTLTLTSERLLLDNLCLMGNGGAYGAGATNGNALVLDNAQHINLKNCFIEYNGGHGILTKNGCWNIFINGCYIYQNAGDGCNFINDSSQSNSGQNGNNVSVINSCIAQNGGNGINWCSAGLNVNGCSIEQNKKAGVCINAYDSTSSAMGANITGNYFESNNQGQILLTSGMPDSISTLYRVPTGINIEGNYFYNAYAGEDGASALILSDSHGYYDANTNTTIGVNVYSILPSIQGICTANVYLDTSRASVSVRSDSENFELFIVNGSGRVWTPSAFEIRVLDPPTPYEGQAWIIDGTSTLRINTPVGIRELQL